MFEPIRKKSLPQKVYEQLQEKIVGGSFEPGEPLPGERRLAEMLQVNRNAVREALKRLEQARLISIQHGGATTVLNFLRTASMDLLGQIVMGADGALNLKAVRSLMEMRSAIGPDVARLCALRWEAPLDERLLAIVRAMEEADLADLASLQALDMDLWMVLVGGSDNVAYQLAFNSIRDAWDNIGALMVRVMADEVADVARHRLLAEAVAARDPEAAERIARELNRTGERGVVQALEAI